MSSPESEASPRVATSPELEIEEFDELNLVWRIGFAPDIWAWTPWNYADDEGLFSGRWDDQQGQFRTIYTAASLLGCFLELLAQFRPNRTLLAELEKIVDDDGSVGRHPEAPEGDVGYSWLDGRQYSSAHQVGRYCFITHSDSIAALSAHYPFHRHGIDPADVDAVLS